jgi:transposase
MNVIGIDISKAKLDLLWLRDVTSGKVKTKIHPNTPAGHKLLVNWIVKSTGQAIEHSHCLMEATGIYHEALAYALHAAGAEVSLVNPAKVRDYARSLGVRNKTDKKDSWVIAHYGATQQVRRWQPEPEPTRTLKALINRLMTIEKDRQREANRLEQIAQTGASETVAQSIHTVMAQLDTEKKRLEKSINDHIKQNPQLKNDRELLLSIIGVGPVVSRLMLSVLHSRDFDKGPQCAAYLGLNPIHNESGSSVRGRAHISKAGNARVRAKLYMAAVVCIKHNPDIRDHYQRLLKNGKSKKSALCAAMRKLVHICFGVLKHQQPYQPRTGENPVCV